MKKSIVIMAALVAACSNSPWKGNGPATGNQTDATVAPAPASDAATQPDSGTISPTPDAQAPVADAALPPPDAQAQSDAAVLPDAFVPMADAGLVDAPPAPQPDAAIVQPDAAPATPDATPDSATPAADRALTPDSAPPSPDSAALPPDATPLPSPDAGQQSGFPGSRPENNCGPNPAAPMFVFALCSSGYGLCERMPARYVSWSRQFTVREFNTGTSIPVTILPNGDAEWTLASLRPAQGMRRLRFNLRDNLGTYTTGWTGPNVVGCMLPIDQAVIFCGWITNGAINCSATPCDGQVDIDAVGNVYTAGNAANVSLLQANGQPCPSP